MSNSIFISVVLPVFNGADYIEKAIRSLLNQAVHLEIIVSDDNSADSTLEIVKGFGSDRIKLIENKTNGGQFVNFNRALSLARGDFIQFFSHDDVAHPGFLAAQVSAFACDKRIGLVYSSCNIVDQCGVIKNTADDEGTPRVIDFSTYMDISSKHGALPPSISSVMISRKVLESIGGFDEKCEVAGDLEYFNRVAEKFKIGRNRQLLLDVRVHSGSVTLNKNTQLKYMKEELLILPFYQKHLGDAAYRDILSHREKNRGADHAKYLVRLLLSLDLKRFVAGYKLLSQVHNAPKCFFYAILQSVNIAKALRVFKHGS